MLLFGLLYGLGQCLQYRRATTEWQHRAQWAVEVEEVEEGEEGENGGVKWKIKIRSIKEKDKNAGFTISVPFYISGVKWMFNSEDVNWMSKKMASEGAVKLYKK